MALVNLDEARIDDLVWVWEWVNSDPDQAHIYQFGLRRHFFWTADAGEIPLPDPLPLCGAPGYKRGSHNPIAHHELPHNVDACTWCLVRLVSDYPHLFTKGGV